jgi:hypothetical protein
MLATLALLAFLSPQAAAPAPDSAAPPAVRVEKLTPDELKQLMDAQQAVADAQAKLDRAKRQLKGATEGIEQAHHANTDCGCYLNTAGREYDKVEFKGDSIIIHHIHEAPPASLNPSGSAGKPGQ